MATKQVEYKGQVHEFPDTFTDDQIGAALKSVDAEMQTNSAAKLQRTRDVIDSPQGGKGYKSDTTGDGPDEGAWAATKRVVKGTVDFGKGLVKDVTSASSAPEIGMNLARDLVLRPGIDQKVKADKAEQQAKDYPQADEGMSGLVAGPTHHANAHRMGEFIPVLGPIAAELSTRATGEHPSIPHTKRGDPFGAATEALEMTALPEATKAGGKLVRGTTKAVLKKAVYPNYEAMRTTPGAGEVNPVEAYTPEQIKAHAEANNIPMTAAEILETGGNRALQGVGEKSATGSNIAKLHKSQAQGAVYKLVKREQTAASPDTPTPEAGAVKTKANVAAAKKASRAAADSEYANWRAGLKDEVPVDLSEVNKKFSDQMDANSDIFENIPAEQAGRLKALLSKAKEFGLKSVGEDGSKDVNPVMDINAVHEMRSHWLETAREIARKGRPDSREARLATEIAVELDKAQENALRNYHGPDADAGVAKWRAANEKYKNHMDTYYGDDSVLADIGETGNLDNPGLLDKVIGGGGGNPAKIRQLREAGVDLGPLKRHVWDKVTDSGFGTARNRLGGLSDDFMQELFGDEPGKLDDMYKTARIGRSVRVDSNPSNSGGTLASRSEVEGGMRAGEQVLSGQPAGAVATALRTMVGWPVAKLTHSKFFRDWQTNMPESRLGKWITGEDGTRTPSTPTSGGPNSGGPNPGPASGGGGGGIRGGSPATPTSGSGANGAASKLKRSIAAGEDSGEYPDGTTDFDFGHNAEPEAEAASDTVGTKQGAVTDTAYFERARQRLGKDAPISAVAMEAQRIKIQERMKETGEGIPNPTSPAAASEPTVGDLTSGQRGGTMEEMPSQPQKSNDSADTVDVYHATPWDNIPDIQQRGISGYKDLGFDPDTPDGFMGTGPFVTTDIDHANYNYARTYGGWHYPENFAARQNPAPIRILKAKVPKSWVEGQDPTDIDLGHNIPPENIDFNDITGYHENFREPRPAGRVDILDDYGVKQDIEADPELGNPRSRSVINKLKKRNPEEREIEDGVGPGAMMAKGSPLALRMGPGPSTGRGMKLYHGIRNTADTPNIMEEGLKPPKEQKPYDEWTEEEKSYFEGIPGRFNTFLTRDPKTAEWWARDGDVVETEVPRSAVETTTVNPDYVEGLKGLKAQKTGEFTTVNAGGTIPPWMLKLRKKKGSQ